MSVNCANLTFFSSFSPAPAIAQQGASIYKSNMSMGPVVPKLSGGLGESALLSVCWRGACGNAVLDARTLLTAENKP